MPEIPECKNCGVKMPLIWKQIGKKGKKQKELEELEKRAYDLAQEIAALENGYCGIFCQERAEEKGDSD
jgi:cell division protein FtsB